MVVKKGEYGKGFMKIKFDTGDNLPLNKQLKLHMSTLIVMCIFKKMLNFIRNVI